MKNRKVLYLCIADMVKQKRNAMKNVSSEQLKKRIETLMRVRREIPSQINAIQQELKKRDTIQNQHEEEYKVLLLASQQKGRIVYETEK